jgi:hypothetical protein
MRVEGRTFDCPVVRSVVRLYPRMEGAAWIHQLALSWRNRDVVLYPHTEADDMATQVFAYSLLALAPLQTFEFPQSAFVPIAVGFFGLGTGYFIWGGQALFGFPQADPKTDTAVNQTMGM